MRADSIATNPKSLAWWEPLAPRRAREFRALRAALPTFRRHPIFFATAWCALIIGTFLLCQLNQPELGKSSIEALTLALMCALGLPASFLLSCALPNRVTLDRSGVRTFGSNHSVARSRILRIRVKRSPQCWIIQLRRESLRRKRIVFYAPVSIDEDELFAWIAELEIASP